jgi:hypothetical protein
LILQLKQCCRLHQDKSVGILAVVEELCAKHVFLESNNHQSKALIGYLSSPLATAGDSDFNGVLETMVHLTAEERDNLNLVI